MITKVKKLFKNEAVSYLFWGVGATVVNWIVYTVLSFASPYSMVICNSIAWLAAVLFAYITNRFFVFHSKTHGLTALLREFFLFIGARVFTAVPSVWQNHGYDRHQYTNVRYPFPLDPPYIPQDNPCGAYVHKFEYQKQADAPKAYLNFEGVDSCFYVWLNGTFVGYSQVSHSTSEFDVTPYLKDGENTLAVLVLKWCDGSYLEDQDKFRMSGIFRGISVPAH